jgi:16S rRNA (uracil1498-N3)-methyltransferase
MFPYFYIPFIDKDLPEIDLDEDSSRHIVQVLRMKPGEQIRLTDGKGNLLVAAILEAHKKKCRVNIQERVWRTPPEKKISIAISLLKNANRFEWFLEKATEIGVKEIIPLLCERTEKQHFRQDRMQHILVSAMLQSQQAWLPELRTPTPFPQTAAGSAATYTKKLIAYCEEDQRIPVLEAMRSPDAPGSCLILIGPEGDFSQKEIALAREQGFMPVSLGSTRLRSETAGMVAATLLCMGG